MTSSVIPNHHRGSGIAFRRRWQAGAFTAAGVLLFIACEDWSAKQRNFTQVIAAASALIVALIPGINSLLSRALDRIRHPSARAVRVTTLIVSLFAAWYFLDTADRQNRALLPKFHDEQMYAIQAQLVARGHLWLPQHPLADFFETFHVMVKPVYAPIYFPGTAMLFAPAVWVGLPLSSMGVLIAGAIVGLCYRIFTELFDGVAGMLAALMAIALPSLHFISVMIMSHGAVLFLVLSMVWAWLRWRRQWEWGWALVFGAAAGWAAITRPFDALCFAVPIAIAAVVDLRHRPLRQGIRAAAAVAAGALPFLAIQAIIDLGTTGHVLQTPVSAYAQTYWPAAGMGFKPVDPAFRPPTSLIQLQEYYDKRLVPEINAHAKAGFLRTLFARVLPAVFAGGAGSAVLLILLPLGFFGLRRRVWVIAGAIPIFSACYACYPFILQHYVLVVAPAMIALVLAGIFGWQRVSKGIATAVVFGVVVVCLTSLHEFNPAVHDANFTAPFLVDIYRKLGEIRERSVVLFRYTRGGDFDEEPVYNTDVAWPDDAPIIRAHDLGDENDRLFAYYAKVDPERVIYRYERKTLTLDRLGTARELATRRPADH